MEGKDRLTLEQKLAQKEKEMELILAIDPRIETRCVACPPDPHPEEYWCAWEFSIKSPSEN